MYIGTVSRRTILPLPILCSLLLAFATGCVSTAHVRPNVHASLPKEMAKTSPLVAYDIGISDILIVEVPRMVPRSPYHLQSSDLIQVTGYGLEELELGVSIFEQCRIHPGGGIILPPPIGAVNVAGMTCEEAGELITAKLSESIGMKPDELGSIGVTVNLLSISGMQPIAAEHLVGADGRINLGIYGSVHVAGLTIPEAKEAIEFQLSRYLDAPEVAVDVYSINSKNYYVIMQGAGFGDKLMPFPYTGNETVLDAIAGINGMERVSSKRVWIARPSPSNCRGEGDILIVDWQGITADASYCTNYQLMPNDRIYIEEDKLVAFDTKLSKVIAPLERIMGFSLLGAQTATRFSGPVLKGGGDPSGGGRGY